MTKDKDKGPIVDLTPREIEMKIKKTGCGQYWKLYYSSAATPAILRVREEKKGDQK